MDRFSPKMWHRVITYLLSKIQALSENKVLSNRGVNFARQITTNLEKMGFGFEVKEGSQNYFLIDEENALARNEEIGVDKQACIFLSDVSEKQQKR